jgi:hypothetical protein
MTRRSTFLSLVIAATLTVAGCGHDNTSNDNCAPCTQPTHTAVQVTPTLAPQVTATPTVTEGTPVEATPTATVGTPVPTQTSTPGTGGQFTLTTTSAVGSSLDTGWTGLSHNQAAIEQVKVTVNLDCTGDDCTINGPLKDQLFGSPLPLSSNNVAVCVRNVFREDITGTYNKATGCASASVKLTSFVSQTNPQFYNSPDDQPCPVCDGDVTPNDGIKDGTCVGKTTTPGAPCDVGGISPNFGSTSGDCLPSAGSIGELEINLDPLTTGAISHVADVDCTGTNQPPGSCYCAPFIVGGQPFGQDRQNACQPDKDSCGSDGFCTGDPIDTRCTGQDFRVCDTDSDCTLFNAGTCTIKPRACFADSIAAEGQCGTEGGTLVAFFCIPPTRAPAVNTVAGLPGPGLVTLPGTTQLLPR